MAMGNVAHALVAPAISFDLKVLFRTIWISTLLASGLALAVQGLDYAAVLERIPRTFRALGVAGVAAFGALALTNSAHDLVWRSLRWDDTLHSRLGPAGYLALGYIYLLALVGTTATFVVAARARGRLRYQAAWVGLGAFVVLGGYTLDVARNNDLLEAPLSAAVWSAAVLMTGLSILAVALFRLQAFDLTPVARHRLVEHMRDAMLVVDAKRRVVDANPAAARMFGLDRAKVVGRDVRDVLSGYQEVAAAVVGGVDAAGRAGSAPLLMDLEHDHQAPCGRIIEMEFSRLAGVRGVFSGCLVVCRDVTEVRRAQATVDRQRLALATLRERERLGRELHDGLAQVLAFAKLQVAATSEALERSDAAQTRAELGLVGAVLQEAHEEVRDFLLGIKSGATTGDSPATAQGSGAALCAAVSDFVARFSAAHRFSVEVLWHTDPKQITLDPQTQVQLMRILQESLVNVYRHAQVTAASVGFECHGGMLRMMIKDEGVGFSTAGSGAGPTEMSADGEAGHYGMAFMRERAEAVGGTLEVLSESGRGAEVRVTVPAA